MSPITVRNNQGWVYPTANNAVIVAPRSPNIGPGPSSVTVISPASGATVAGTMHVAFTTDRDSEAGIAYLAVDGVLYACLEGGGHGFTFDTAALPDGAHTVTVYAGIVSAESFGRYASSGAIPVTVSNYVYPGKAIHVAGAVNNACELADALFAPTTSGLTVAFWFRVTSDTGANETLASLSANGTAGWKAQWVTGTNAVRFVVVNNGATPTNSPTRPVAVGGWHLFVGANANTGLDVNNLVYVSLDGEAKQTTTHSTAGPMTTGTNRLALGYDTLGNGTYSVADLDEPFYWNRVLSDAEVALVWNSGVGVNMHDLNTNPALSSLLTGLAGGWDCDDTGGANLADATGGGRTLIGKNSTSTYTSVSGVR